MCTTLAKILLYHTRAFRTTLLDLQQNHQKYIIIINRSRGFLNLKRLPANAPPPQSPTEKSAAMVEKIYVLKLRFRKKISSFFIIYSSTRHVLQIITKQILPVDL